MDEDMNAELFEALELLRCAEDFAFWLADVNLNNLCACCVTRILNLKRNRAALVLFEVLFLYLKIAVLKCCVGKTEAEGEQNIFLCLVIISVAHENAFAVLTVNVGLRILTCCGSIVEADRIGLGKLAAGIAFAAENVGNCLVDSLTAEVGVKNSLYIVNPRHFNG